MGDDGMPEAAGKLNDTGLWEMPPTGFVPAFVFVSAQALESKVHG
jgi:hypothetical protein